LEILLRAVLEPAQPGEEIEIVLASRAVAFELPGWARVEGHQTVGESEEGSGASRRWLVRLRRGTGRQVLASPPPEASTGPTLRDGRFQTGDWRERAVPEVAGAAEGFVPLGSRPEAGGPPFHWRLNRRDELWAPELGQLVDGAAAAQWNAARDIPWEQAGPLPKFLEQAVCQVVTYLAQNEYAAYYVPSRFLGAVNPQFAEVLMWLASHVHDEARHIEVFTKRALVSGSRGVALASTQHSLHALLQESDFTAAALLLNVLGEGSFLDLLQFIASHAPDAATATAARLAHRDELRHVRFGVTHVRHVLERNPETRFQLLAAAEERASRLVDVSGLSPLVSDALAVMAAGSMQPAQLAEGARAVQDLMRRMADNRVRRLQEAGLKVEDARRLSDLHTPNLM
jgi:TusA-related sulfurtransferase